MEPRSKSRSTLVWRILGRPRFSSLGPFLKGTPSKVNLGLTRMRCETPPVSQGIAVDHNSICGFYLAHGGLVLSEISYLPIWSLNKYTIKTPKGKPHEHLAYMSWMESVCSIVLESARVGQTYWRFPEIPVGKPFFNPYAENAYYRSSSRETRIRVPSFFYSVVYFSRGTLPKKETVNGHLAGGPSIY